MSLSELLTATPSLQQAILSFESAASLLEISQKEGFKTMREWGEELIAQGVTSREEVERVCM